MFDFLSFGSLNGWYGVKRILEVFVYVLKVLRKLLVG